MSILAQLTLAGSDGTFQRAVIQSAATSPWLDETAVDRCAQWLRTTLGTLDLLPALQALPLEKLLSLGAALDEALRPALGHGVFRPQQGQAGLGTTEEDGITRAAARGCLLLGCNGDEQRLFLFAQPGLGEQAALRRLRAGLNAQPFRRRRRRAPSGRPTHRSSDRSRPGRRSRPRNGPVLPAAPTTPRRCLRASWQGERRLLALPL